MSKAILQMSQQGAIVRCDRRYLFVVLALRLTCVAALAVWIAQTLSWQAAIALGGLGSIILVIHCLVRLLWKFTIGLDHIRTEKLFTKDIDVRVPFGQVVAVSTKEGIMEAIFDVGTLQISTASSLERHAEVRWPHLSSCEQLAERLQKEVSLAVARRSHA